MGVGWAFGVLVMIQGTQGNKPVRRYCPPQNRQPTLALTSRHPRTTVPLGCRKGRGREMQEPGGHGLLPAVVYKRSLLSLSPSGRLGEKRRGGGHSKPARQSKA